MEWINLTVAQLNSPEFRGSEINDRGVWLSLLAYCMQQENSGCIRSALNMSDWEYTQVLGVPKTAVAGEHRLWCFKGEHLYLQAYPIASQRKVQAKRSAGTKGGRSSGKARRAKKAGVVEHKDKDKGKDNSKDNGKENQGLAGVIPTLDQWISFGLQHAPNWPEADARGSFDHYVACGWRMGEGRGKPVKDWQACVRTCSRRWAEKNRVVENPGNLFVEAQG